jgi:hypothetical protein
MRAASTGVLLATVLLATEMLSASTGRHPSGSSVSAARAATTPSAVGPCVAGWRELPVPNRAFRGTPSDLVVRHGRPAWVMGSTTNGVLALRWDGNAWRWVATPTRGHAGVSAAVISGRRSLLAVGYQMGKAGEPRAISARIQGSTWHGRRIPEPPGRIAVLSDVVRRPSGKAWAVGTRHERGRLRAYALRWTGSRWVRDEPALGIGSGLQAVETAPNGTVWAVGWREVKLGVPRPYIVRRGRRGWASVPVPTLPGGAAVLTDVRFRTARDGWAIGYLGEQDTDQHVAFLLHWNGTRWRRARLPWADQDAAIPRALAVSAAGDLWITGTQTATAQRESRGFIARRSSTGTWQVDVLGTPSDIRSEGRAVAVTNGGAIAAATVGSSLVMLESCSAGVGAAANRRSKVRISHMKARRRAGLEEDVGSSDVDAAASGGRAVGTGALRRLPSPVAPRGFMVRDVSEAVGLGQVAHTYGGLAADLDGDGDRDLFMSLHSGLPRLALDVGERFRDAPTSAFTFADRHGCDAADVDGDGTRDILCAIGAARGKWVKRHELSLAPGTDAAALARGGLGISDPLGRGRRVAFLRLDPDGFPEVFITSSPIRSDGLPSSNRLYRNVSGRFVPARGQRLDSGDGGDCAEGIDFDRDGDDDLLYCGGSLGKRRPGLRIMRNERGRLRDRTGRLGVTPLGDRDVALGDVTGDGRRDLVQLGRGRLRISRWTGTRYHVIYEARVAGGVAVATGDVDGDGRDDVYVVRTGTRTNAPDRLLLSRDRGRRFVSVAIPQTTKGAGDDVIALDYDDNGLVDFVVLNGRSRAGPVMLLAAVPRP